MATEPLPVEQFPAPSDILAIADAARDAAHVLSQYWIIEGLPPDLNPAQFWTCPGGTDHDSLARFHIVTISRILSVLNDLDSKVAGLVVEYPDGLSTDLPKGLFHPIPETAVRGWPYSIHRAIDELKGFRHKFRGDEPMYLKDIQGLAYAEDVLRKAAIPNEPNAQSVWASSVVEQEDRKPESNRGGESDSGTKPVNRYDALDNVPPAAQKAYFSFLYAERRAGTRLEDKEAYDRLEEYGIDLNDANGVLADYRLPSFDTWARQVRKARRATGERKYTPRIGRNIHGSD